MAAPDNRPKHISVAARVVSPKKAVAYQLALDLHSSGAAQNPERLAATLRSLGQHDATLGRLVRSELEAYGDPVL